MRIRLAVFVALSLVGMIVDHRFAYLESLRSALSVVVNPIHYVVDFPMRVTEWVHTNMAARQSMSDENARIHKENFLLRSRTQRFAALQTENRRLRELFDATRRFTEQVLVADLLAVELEPLTQKVLLDKGSKQGVYIGQPIIDARGIMGQIIHVNPMTSTGMLITDINHALPVKVNRNGLRAIASGKGINSELELLYVPTHSDLREGDLVVSSGMGGRFPKGYPVGTVEEVVIDPTQVFATITISPTAQLSKASEVLLMWLRREVADAGQTVPAGLN